MTNPAADTGTQQTSNRYRLPGIEREGIAQLSLIETALWPLRGGKLDHSTYETSHTFKADGQQRSANVRVYAPQGLQSIDEYVLWGLLGITLSRPDADGTLLATPYWMIKRLGMAMGGFQYDQLRASLERLAMVAYQNTGFYNPLSQQHERITLHFLSSFLPTNGRGGDVSADRVWRIEWDRHFFDMCRATGGTLLFDLDLYRQLSPASRRLFLKLKDRFWRNKRVFLNVDDLTINGLGFSADRPLKKRKYDLTCCIRELLDHRVIELGRGQTDPRDLFIRRSKGLYVVLFHEGEYFRQPLAKRTTARKNAITDDPLYEPLRRIGVDEPAIQRVFRQCTRGNIERWLRITDAAMHERPTGFPGFKSSPAAFFIDAVQNQRLPPDWIYMHEKQQRQRRWEQDRAAAHEDERHVREHYEQHRADALRDYLQSPEGRGHHQAFYEQFLIYHRALDPHTAEQAARDAAANKVEREHFDFPDFSVWRLEQQT